ncbi:MAG: hypothetical protein ACFFCQ_17105, partial [Promethearchaeota archaeon]
LLLIVVILGNSVRNANVTDENLSNYWICPKDGCKMVEHVKRNESGIFQIHRKQFEVSLSNAIAVKKILPNQEEEARNLAQLLLNKTDEPTVSLVSVTCAICGFKGIAPKISKIDISISRKKQFKTISSLTQAAQKKRARYTSLTSGQRFPIWYILWLGPLILAFIATVVIGVLAAFRVSPDELIDLLFR